MKTVTLALILSFSTAMATPKSPIDRTLGKRYVQVITNVTYDGIPFLALLASETSGSPAFQRENAKFRADAICKMLHNEDAFAQDFDIGIVNQQALSSEERTQQQAFEIYDGKLHIVKSARLVNGDAQANYYLFTYLKCLDL